MFWRLVERSSAVRKEKTLRGGQSVSLESPHTGESVQTPFSRKFELTIDCDLRSDILAMPAAVLNLLWLQILPIIHLSYNEK